MLPRSKSLWKLVKSNASFVLYGQKSSGKTTLIHKVLQQAQAKFIYINCTLTAKKQTFMHLFNVELNKFLTKSGLKFQKLGKPSNIDSWINQMKNLIESSEQVIQHLNNLVIFLDNIEEINLSEFFIPTFYTACQKQFAFRVSFIFCGTNFRHKQYCLQLPFRTLIYYCMDKPLEQYKAIIDQITYTLLNDKYQQHNKSNRQNQNVKKAAVSLSAQIKAGFQNITVNLQKIKVITRSVCEAVLESIDMKDPHKQIMGLINKNDLPKILNQVKQKGGFVPEYQMKRKIVSTDNEETIDINSNLQFYPYLILTSVHLADYYHEKQDKRRFQDYKNRTNQRNKELKRSEFKIGKHNFNRIIAISQSLQSQTRQNDKQRVIHQHSLDYYMTFEHVKKMGRLKFYGNKLTGVIKEEEAKAFMSKNDLQYNQFMSSN